MKPQEVEYNITRKHGRLTIEDLDQLSLIQEEHVPNLVIDFIPNKKTPIYFDHLLEKLSEMDPDSLPALLSLGGVRVELSPSAESVKTKNLLFLRKKLLNIILTECTMDTMLYICKTLPGIKLKVFKVSGEVDSRKIASLFTKTKRELCGWKKTKDQEKKTFFKALATLYEVELLSQKWNNDLVSKLLEYCKRSTSFILSSYNQYTICVDTILRKASDHLHTLQLPGAHAQGRSTITKCLPSKTTHVVLTFSTLSDQAMAFLGRKFGNVTHLTFSGPVAEHPDIDLDLLAQHFPQLDYLRIHSARLEVPESPSSFTASVNYAADITNSLCSSSALLTLLSHLDIDVGQFEKCVMQHQKMRRTARLLDAPYRPHQELFLDILRWNTEKVRRYDITFRQLGDATQTGRKRESTVAEWSMKLRNRFQFMF